jgi:putative heme-binding domain-containing protein
LKLQLKDRHHGPLFMALCFSKKIRAAAGGLTGLIFTLSAAICAGQNVALTNQQALADFAMQHAGDAESGRRIFREDKRMVCINCHTADGRGGKAGPDLSAIGDKFSRNELIRSVLEPSASIDVGYGTTVVRTKNGEDAQGVIKRVTEEWIEIMGGDGRMVRIATADIKEQHNSAVSLMPTGLVAPLQPQEFSDLITYLGSLQQRIAYGTNSPIMPQTIPRAEQSVGIMPFFSAAVHLEEPTWFGEVPGFTNLFVVLEHAGHSWIIEHTEQGDKQSVLVDLSGETAPSGATGLLGLAFHPRFAKNRKYYLQYQTIKNSRTVTEIMERQFAADFKSDSSRPSREVMEIVAATQNHTGGAIEFGPDDYLYIGMGDTGPQYDTEGHGQNLSLLLGKMLRIDVDHSENGKNYAIPKDNPFVTQTNARPEIWAYGLREPWRFSFDPLTGDLWLGDVGQDRFEEVDILRAGENMGWNVFEGIIPHSQRYRRPNEVFVPPVFAYAHRFGVSVTGGYVYRGHRAPAMYGRYICGDFQLGSIWALTQTNRVMSSVEEIGLAPSRLVSFARDHEGELYVVGFDSGQIYQLDLAKVKPFPR